MSEIPEVSETVCLAMIFFKKKEEKCESQREEQNVGGTRKEKTPKWFGKNVKKRQEQQNKLNEQLKKTQNLFKLGFSRESKEHQPHDSPSTSSASHTRVVDPVEVPWEPFEQIGQDQETATLDGAEESETETEVIHQNVVHLGVEYQNDIGLWQNITNEMQDFWCTRDPNECQHFECDFSASSRQYDDSKRFFFSVYVFSEAHKWW
ncbi:uncharacterized protein TNCT_390991 [Trichonephila clavata]|uniref:Uncharacterized protein n=1 Tax=Trichonephila clavata TaxID=2740835 RepID=A0A8X6HL78_TRICU|nr:uncharacterized protein TNCT_390991 [Trichonephila clavata]